jgi:hypothetical protein
LRCCFSALTPPLHAPHSVAACSKLRACAAQWAAQERASPAAIGSTLSVLASGQAERAPAALSRDVVVEVRALPEMPGAREVSARVDVAAPAEMVWRTLTDYERLAGACAPACPACAPLCLALTPAFVRSPRAPRIDIVPSLDENRILERWAGGVRLLQARARWLRQA